VIYCLLYRSMWRQVQRGRQYKVYSSWLLALSPQQLQGASQVVLWLHTERLPAGFLLSAQLLPAAEVSNRPARQLTRSGCFIESSGADERRRHRSHMMCVCCHGCLPRCPCCALHVQAGAALGDARKPLP
jgi:hypothetical protein